MFARLLQIRRHLVFVLCYSSLLAAEGLYEIWTMPPSGAKTVPDSGPASDTIVTTIASVLNDFTRNLVEWVKEGNHTEPILNMCVMVMSVGVVHRMHKEGRVKYALGFHIKQ